MGGRTRRLRNQARRAAAKGVAPVEVATPAKKTKKKATKKTKKA